MTPHDRIPPAFDAALIARVLDGRATAEERASLLAAADESPELLGILADSAAVMNAAEAAHGSVTPIESRRRRRLSPGIWAGIAAVIVAAVTIPGIWSRGGGVPPFPAEAIGGDAALGAARIGGAVTTTRGAPSGDRAVQSVIVGARLVDYLTLAQRSDTSAATAAIEIAAALRSFAGGAAAATQFDHATGGMPPDALSSIEQAVDLPRFRAGAWTERARLAAAASNATVLAAPETHEAFERIAADGTLSDDARSIAREMLTALNKPPVDAAMVASVAARLLVALPR